MYYKSFTSRVLYKLNEYGTNVPNTSLQTCYTSNMYADYVNSITVWNRARNLYNFIIMIIKLFMLVLYSDNV